MVKNLPAMEGTWVVSSLEDLLEEGMTTHSSILGDSWRIPIDRGAWGVLQSMGSQNLDTTER